MRISFFIICFCWLTTSQAKGVYQAPDEFIQQAFSGNPPAPQTIWLKKDLKKTIATILSHRYSKLRVRYWLKDQRSVWILEEIGKEKPITTGIIINNNHIVQVKVLIFRESRGWEVRHDFFANQFKDASLTKKLSLNNSIDNITGATLSVRAVTRLARMALFLHQHVTKAKHDSPKPQ